MSSCLQAAVIAAIIGWAGAAGAASLHKDGMTTREIQAWLNDSGYKAELARDGEDEYVKSSAEGVSFEVHPYDCKSDRCASMQMIVGFDVDGKITTDQANAWNRSKRYIDCYIDDEGDPWFTYDVNLSPGGTREALDDDFAVWLNFLPDMKEHIGWD